MSVINTNTNINATSDKNTATDSIRIRIAREADAAALLAIYAPYVTDTAISFECTVPDEGEFAGRIRNKLPHYPYLVAERNSTDSENTNREILGYAYTSPFVGREAYSWAAETTIYLGSNGKGKGLGRRLYQVLEEISRRQNIKNLEACIGTVTSADDYLSNYSRDFHAHMGFRLVGEFHKCGRKFNHWYNMVWMEKIIGEHGENQLPVRPFTDLTDEELMACGISL